MRKSKLLVYSVRYQPYKNKKPKKKLTNARCGDLLPLARSLVAITVLGNCSNLIRCTRRQQHEVRGVLKVLIGGVGPDVPGARTVLCVKHATRIALPARLPRYPDPRIVPCQDTDNRSIWLCNTSFLLTLKVGHYFIKKEKQYNQFVV